MSMSNLFISVLYALSNCFLDVGTDINLVDAKLRSIKSININFIKP